MPKAFFKGTCIRTPEDIAESTEYTKSLGLPWLEPPKEPDRTPLAIVGGGPSIKSYEHEIMDWPGEIWAVNRVFIWLKQRKKRSTLFTIDPDHYGNSDHPTFEFVGRGDKVIMHPRVPRWFTDHVLWAEADVRLFDLFASATGTTWAVKLAAMMGRADVTLFGCESSYTDGTTHAFENLEVKDKIVVESGGKEFLTKPELLYQAIWLSDVIRAFPKVYREKGGGLLSAMVATGDHDITKMSRWMLEGA